MTRHFCYEGDDCDECNAVGIWVTLERIPAPIVWQWWIAVPAAWLRRKLRL